jgi:DNA topoisomerase-1
MHQLLILESPNKVKDVQRYAQDLGQPCVVMATCGHLLDLPPMRDGPCVDTNTFLPARLVPRDQASADRVAQLKREIALASKVIVATDPDREGEGIAAELWSWIPPAKAFRATFEEITRRGIELGLAGMSPALNQPAADAAAARRVIDRLAGWHATSVVFEKLRHLKGLSAGRLQSAALRLVVERCLEVQGFKPTSSYGIRLKLRTAFGQAFTARLLGPDNTPLVFKTMAEAQAFPKPSTATVTAVDSKQQQQKPKPPFEATSWLQVAQKALGLDVKTAAAATQALFEQGQTTYPRTDTVRVSSDAIEWARSEIARRFGDRYLPVKPHDHKARGNVQGAHEAIRPTIPHEAAELQARQAGPLAPAYALIEARFLASQAAPRIVELTHVTIVANGALYEAAGQVEIFDGWKRVLRTDAEEEPDEPPQPGAGEGRGGEHEAALPPLQAGDTLTVHAAEVVTITTKAKALFTQASLVAELKRLGIGRPSTYPTIVPLLLSRGWVKEQAQTEPTKKRGTHPAVLLPEPVAFELADFLATAFPSLVDFSFTAVMEEQLDHIEAAKSRPFDVCSSWWRRFEAELLEAKAIKPRMAERPDLGPCPKCHAQGRVGRLRLIQGRKDDRSYEFAACDQDTKETRVCGHTAPTEKGALMEIQPCPVCAASMRPVRRRDGGHSWVCSSCPDTKWFLADKAWRIVKSPTCPRCSNPMTHREKTNQKGEFFWGCFACHVFHPADVFGRLAAGR